MLKKLYFLCVIFGLLFSPFVFSQQDNAIVHGPFNLSWCNEGKFYFEETSDLDYPINFVLECSDNKKIVDKYDVDGANIIHFSNEKKIDIDIESVFFHKVQSKKHLFVIVRRGSNHQVIGQQGNEYRVYVYVYDPEKIIQLDEGMMKDRNLSGVEGELEGEESHFKYKTAAEVKKYIDKTYNKK